MAQSSLTDEPFKYEAVPSLHNGNGLIEKMLNDLSQFELHCSQYLLIISTNTLLVNLCPLAPSPNTNLDLTK